MSSWIVLTLIAAIFLGFYEIAKKKAVTDNAVPPVLLLNVTTAALIWAVPVLIEYFGGVDLGLQLGLHQITLQHHLLLLGKSALVGASWMVAFVAIKHLPLSIASPIRATSPFWTILLAITFFNERPAAMQWAGIVLILLAFYSFSLAGSREGIRFRNNRYVWLIVLATLISASSGIYDKYLLQTAQIKPAVVQAWFSIYLVPVMLPLFCWWRFDTRAAAFQFRWSIPLIAIFLLLADYLYFVALAQPEAMISIISPLRRTSIVIAFLFGIIVLKEQNWQRKSFCLLILGVGIYLISVK